jgi:hypothetical protein
MTADQAIRESRRHFVVNERMTAGWKRHWRNQSSMRYDLSQRRETRLFRKMVYSNEAFRRLVTHLSNQVEVTEFLIRLHVLKFYVERPFDSEKAKLTRKKYFEAYENVRIAARVLRNYIDSSSHPEDRKLLTEVAETIERAPALGVAGDDDAVFTLMFYDYSLMGQKGDKRGFVIRALDQIVPGTAPHRDAMIRDLLKLFRIIATSQFVRSTLKNGRT